MAYMSLLANILPYAQIILSVILVLAIMLQQTGAGVGGALGGGDSGSFHHTRRGFEKFLFILSIVCGILFAVSAFLAILIKAKG
jgi:protein translocase SecG subunit